MGFFRDESDVGGPLYSRRQMRVMIKDLHERIEEEEAKKEELLSEIERIDETIAALTEQLDDLRYLFA